MEQHRAILSQKSAFNDSRDETFFLLWQLTEQSLAINITDYANRLAKRTWSSFKVKSWKLAADHLELFEVVDLADIWSQSKS